MDLFGRRVIYTDETEITRDNILKVLSDAYTVHQINKQEIDYLYRYYRGRQPILDRTKDIRPEICNKIVVNRANEIVSFKVGYLIGEPIQYVSRKPKKSKAIIALNDTMYDIEKANKDKLLSEWNHICGTAYRYVGLEDDDLMTYTLDPRYTFVVYSKALGNKPLLSGTYIEDDSKNRTYTCYSANHYWEINGESEIIRDEPTPYERLQIIEYPLNKSRLGAFEIVIGLLDAINETTSDRVDGIEQFIQALMVFKGVDIEDEQFAKLKELGGIKVPIDGDVKYLIQEMNQTQTQTLIDDMYDTVLTICGMPNRNGGSSTSDTGSAVIMRDGWSSAEARAKDSEDAFKESERDFLKVALEIYNTVHKTKLQYSDIDIRFTRRNYENIQLKAQVLTTMLNNDKIHPRLAFEHCGMFPDSELAYEMSMEYAEEQQKKLEAELMAREPMDATESDADVRENGSDNNDIESNTD